MSILSRVFDIVKANFSYILRDQETKDNDFSYNQKTEEGKKTHSNSYLNNKNSLAQYYANLEIPSGSDLQTTKKAWRKMMKKYHPDLHAKNDEKRETATILTRELTKAYNEIKTALKRK